MTTIAQLTLAKLDESSRDLDQARLGIEAIRALLPVLEGTAEPELQRDLGQLLASLQVSYASAVSGPKLDEAGG